MPPFVMPRMWPPSPKGDPPDPWRDALEDDKSWWINERGEIDLVPEVRERFGYSEVKHAEPSNASNAEHGSFGVILLFFGAVMACMWTIFS